MKNTKEFEKKLKRLNGSILIIGDLGEDINILLDNNTKITETYWLNASNTYNDEKDDGSLDVANDFNLAKLHKYLKKGIDNIVCNYDEIKKELPKFIRESLRVTKKNIYLSFDKKFDYESILKKYKRYNINCSIEEYDDFNLLIAEANDIIVNEFKELYYYIKDNLEKIYNKISDSF